MSRRRASSTSGSIASSSSPSSTARTARTWPGCSGCTHHRRGDPMTASCPAATSPSSRRRDFAGVNHYTNTLISADPEFLTGTPHDAGRADPDDVRRSDTPDALRDVLLRVSREFTPLPLYVTENGATFADYPTPRRQGARPRAVALPPRATPAAWPTRWPRGPTCAGTSRGRSSTTSSGRGATRCGSASSTSTTRPWPESPKDSAYWYRDLIAAPGRGQPRGCRIRHESARRRRGGRRMPHRLEGIHA